MIASNSKENDGDQCKFHRDHAPLPGRTGPNELAPLGEPFAHAHG
jgi:hypothetical protein